MPKRRRQSDWSIQGSRASTNDWVWNLFARIPNSEAVRPVRKPVRLYIESDGQEPNCAGLETWWPYPANPDVPPLASKERCPAQFRSTASALPPGSMTCRAPAEPAPGTVVRNISAERQDEVWYPLQSSQGQPGHETLHTGFSSSFRTRLPE